MLDIDKLSDEEVTALYAEKYGAKPQTQQERQGGLLSAVDAFQAGVGDLGSGVGEGLAWIGDKVAGRDNTFSNTMRGFAESSREFADEQMEEIRLKDPDTYAELTAPIITYNAEKDRYEAGDGLTLKALAIHTVRSAPSTIATMVPGLGAAGVAARGVSALGASAKAAGLASKAGMIGGMGAAGGGLSAGNVLADVRAQVMDAGKTSEEMLAKNSDYQKAYWDLVDAGVDDDAARKQARAQVADAVGKEAGALAGALTGGSIVALGPMLAKMAPKSLSPGAGLGGGAVARTLTGATVEGAQETAEAAGEQYASNVAMQAVDPERETFTGHDMAQAMGEGLVGGVMGGGMGMAFKEGQQAQPETDNAPDVNADQAAQSDAVRADQQAVEPPAVAPPPSAPPQTVEPATPQPDNSAMQADQAAAEVGAAQTVEEAYAAFSKFLIRSGEQTAQAIQLHNQAASLQQTGLPTQPLAEQTTFDAYQNAKAGQADAVAMMSVAPQPMEGEIIPAAPPPVPAGVARGLLSANIKPQSGQNAAKTAKDPRETPDAERFTGGNRYAPWTSDGGAQFQETQSGAAGPGEFQANLPKGGADQTAFETQDGEPRATWTSANGAKFVDQHPAKAGPGEFQPNLPEPEKPAEDPRDAAKGKPVGRNKDGKPLMQMQDGTRFFKQDGARVYEDDPQNRTDERFMLPDELNALTDDEEDAGGAAVTDTPMGGDELLGQNWEGIDVWEDENGVRYTKSNGIINRESVKIAPGGGKSVDVSKRGADFLTEQEYGEQPAVDDDQTESIDTTKEDVAVGKGGGAALSAADHGFDENNFSGMIATMLANGIDLSNKKTFSSMAEGVEMGEKLKSESGKPLPTVKLREEFTELGMVLAARKIVADADKTPQQKFRALVDLQERMPKLGERTGKSITMQAYSTPISLAYLASRAAGINSKTSVYEPTAGHGALLLEADPAKVIANELDPDRAARLRAIIPNVSQENGVTHSPGKEVDVVIANPPFGSVKDDNGQSIKFQLAGKTKTTAVDFAIVWSALKSMKQNGRAVLIIGGQHKMNKTERQRANAYNVGAKRAFFANLYKQYNVVDHFEVSGDLYRKQGAAWPVDVIIIDGKGESALDLPAVKPPRQLSTLDELETILVENAETTAADAGAGRGAAASVGRVRGEPDSDPQGQNALDQRRGEGRLRGDDGVSDVAGSDRGRSGERGRGAGDDPQHAGVVGERQQADGVLAEAARDGQPGRQVQDAGARDRGESQRGGRGVEHEGGPGGQGTDSVELGRDAGIESGHLRPGPADAPGNHPVGGHVDRPTLRKSERVLEQTATQAPYRPSSRARSLETHIPTNQREPAERALSDLEDRVGDIDAFVAGKLGYNERELYKAFGAEQIDGLALAIDNVDKGRGFVIGDQTGVGKGRFVAGMLRYAMRQGRTPVFFTEKPSLFGDLSRDLKDIGMAGVSLVSTNTLQAKEDQVTLANGKKMPKSDTKKKTAELEGYAKKGLPKNTILVSTYDQMNTQKGNLKPAQRAMQEIAKDAFVVLDESHNAGGQEGDKITRGSYPRSILFREFVQNAHSAVFSSATFAKRPGVMSLYSNTDIGAAIGRGSVTEVMERGGVPMQQIVSMGLSEAGQYLRRERLFTGIKYETRAVETNKETYEQFSASLRAIFDFSEKHAKPAVEIMGEDLRKSGSIGGVNESTGKGGADSVNFAGLMHNVIGQMLLSAKAKATADIAVAEVKAGRRPVIAVSSTMESFIKNLREDLGLSAGDSIEADFGYVLRRYLEKSRMVTIKDSLGNKSQRLLDDSELGTAGVEAYEDALSLIEETDFSDYPVSPLDYMRAKFDQEGLTSREITGREERLDYADGLGGGALKFAVRDKDEVGQAGKQASVNGFNDGSIDVLILNKSGSTGLSIHASEKFKDQRQRVMLIAQPDANIDTFVQMLGRINRTGQVEKPEYIHLISDIPAEKRPASVLLKKMASLSANTTGGRKSDMAGKEVVPDLMNALGVQAVREYFDGNVEQYIAIGAPIGDVDYADNSIKWSSKGEIGDLVGRVTGRMPMLPRKQQEEFWKGVTETFSELLNQAKATGSNPLEAETLELDAKEIESVDLTPKNAAIPGSPFGQPSFFTKMDVKNLGKPFTRAQVEEKIAKDNEIEEYADWADLNRKIAFQGMRMFSDAVEAIRQQAKEAIDALRSNRKEDEPQADFNKRLTKERSKWTAAWDKFNGFTQSLEIGSTYVLKSDNGNVYGVLGKVSRNAKVKNPSALGAWRATFYVADAMRQITVPFSRIAISDRDSKEGDGKFVVRPAQALTFGDGPTIQIMDAFDQFQGVAREERIIITGNVVAGFSAVDAKGSVIQFRDSTGKVRNGVMMPKGFRVDTFNAERKLYIDDPAKAAAFLEDTRDGYLIADVGTSGKQVRVMEMVSRPGVYKVIVPKTKKDGAAFFGSKAVLEAIGQGDDVFHQDREQRGDLVARLDDVDRLPALLYALNKAGARFYAEDDREGALAAIGLPDIVDTNPTNGKLRAARYLGDKYKLKGDKAAASVAEVQAIVDDRFAEVAKRHGINFVIRRVPNEKDLSDGANKDDQGAAYGDTIYLYAANMQGSKRSIQAVIWHELYAHFGLHIISEKEQKRITKQIINARISPFLEPLWSEIETLYPNATLTVQAEEVIARLAEKADSLPVRLWDFMTKLFMPVFGKENRLGAFAARDARDLIREISAGMASGKYVGAERREFKGNMYHRRADVVDASARTPGKHTTDQAKYLEAIGVKKQPVAFKERVRGAFGMDKDRVKQGVFDRMHGIKKLRDAVDPHVAAESDPYIMARLSTGSSSTLAAFLGYGQGEWKDGVIQQKAGTKGLIPILNQITDAGVPLDDFIGWMVARRAARLKSEGRENYLSAEQIKAGLSLAKGHAPLFAKVNKQVQDFNQSVLDIAEHSGLIDKEVRQLWRDHGDYIPFYRISEDDIKQGPRNRGGFSHQGSGIKRLKGGDSALNDPLANLIQNTAHLLDASMKNEAIKRTVDMAVRAKSDVLSVAPYQFKPEMIPSNQIEALIENEFGANLAEFGAGELKGLKKLFALKPPNDPNVVRVMRDGKAEYYTVSDPLLLDALKGVDQKQLTGALKPFRWFRRALTRGVTASPDFMLRNFVRDSVQTSVIDKHGVKPFIDALHGAVKAYNETGAAADMLFSGASFQGGNTYGYDPESTAHTIRHTLRAKGWSEKDIAAHMGEVYIPGKGFLGKAIHKYDQIGDAIENASREAVFEAVMRKTGSKARAAFEAKDLMDFSMQGNFTAMRVMADVLPFFNARVQGLYKLGRAYNADKKGVLWRGAALAGASAALILSNQDEEWYKEQPDFLKDMYWLFKLPGLDNPIKIPKPFEVGFIFGTMPERIIKMSQGTEDSAEALAAIGRGAMATFEVNPIPQMVKPVGEALVNWDFFRWQPIEGAADEGKLAEARYNERTSDAARALVGAAPDLFNAIGLSPKKIEYLVRGYFGTVGAYALEAADWMTQGIDGKPAKAAKAWHDYPIIKSFVVADPANSTLYKTKLYDAIREAESTYRTINAYIQEGNEERALDLYRENAELLGMRKGLNRARKTLSEIRKRIEVIQRDTLMSPAQKREMIDMLRRYEGQFAKNIIDRMK